MTVALAGQLLGQFGHAVGIDDLSAHEYGLLQGNAAGKDVVDVNGEGVVDLCTDGIDSGGDIGGGSGFKDRLPKRTVCQFLGQDRVGHDDLLKALHTHVQSILEQGTGIEQGLGHVLAQQRDILVDILVRADGGDLWQVVGEGNFPIIAGHFNLGTSLFQVFVPFNSHPSAVLQREDLLRRSGERQQRKSCHKENAFHVIMRLFF